MSGFAERLKAARQQQGLTQEQLGFELHVTKASISGWENARDTPSFRLLPKLSKVLDTSLDVLVCGEPSPGRAEGLRTLNEEEVKLLKAYRAMSPKQKKGLLDMLS